ncbi:substrate-binding domain-containing protein [Streptomyces sp. NPDC026092]|uniref:substrate-binding domain-containing protein n=1 Tax=Streptomyces sp. NPDC026092 TaxID=3154797 RepID=UPI0033FBE6D4
MAVPGETYYYREVIECARAAAQGLGARLTLGVSAYAEERPQVERLLSDGVEGLLLTPSPHTPWAPPRLRRGSGLPVPVVLMERRPEPVADLEHLDRVASDHARGTVRALRYLVGLGHRRIGLLACATATGPWIDRGFDTAADILSLPADAPRVTDVASLDVAAVEAFLDAAVATGTTAVVAHPDDQGALLVHRARMRGLVVPDDLAVIAYDDELASLAEIPLSAVAPMRYAVGRIAVTRLVQRLREGNGHGWSTSRADPPRRPGPSPAGSTARVTDCRNRDAGER